MELNKLIQTVKAYRDAETESLLNTAFKIASVAHEGFQLASGEPYIYHPLAVASILADWYAPPAVVAVGLLHDTLNPLYSHGYSMDTVRRKLGSEIARVLEATLGLNGLLRHFEEDLDNEHTMSIEGDYGREANANVLLHEASPFVQEWDAFVIKIADRWHNMGAISTLTREQQQEAARIMLNIFVPLADRLGMGIVKRELEDASFKAINPAYYDLLQLHFSDANLKLEISKASEKLQQVLAPLQGRSILHWQPFSLYTLSHHQIEQNSRHGEFMHDRPLSLRLEDAGALVILTDNESDCYRLLGDIHKIYAPVEKHLQDFIGNPNENGYRALHTQVKYAPGQLLNIIIRTFIMDKVAEYGCTAAWRNVPDEFLPKLPTSTNSIEGKIQVYTAQGEVKYLPLGATPIDFAYEMQTEIGNRCKGALVNGEEGDLYRPLHNGDTVEIIAGGLETSPSPEWLNHVQTLHATHRIRHYLVEQHRNVLEASGRTLLNRELLALGLSANDAEVNRFLTQLAQRDNLASPEDILINIGLGCYKASDLAERLEMKHSSTYEETTLNVTVLSPEAISLQREIAQCCHPTPPDDIVGHRRNNRVLVIHSSLCSRIKSIKDPIAVEWDTTPPEPNYVIVVRALNSSGLASNLSGAIARMGFNMQRFDSRQLADGGMTETHIYLGKTTPIQRMRIQKGLEAFPQVKSVEAINSMLLPKPHLPNPYGPKPAVGPRFYGRDIECQRIRTLVCDQSQNSAILLWGQKRIGKTSLLLRLVEQAGRDFLPVYIDLQGIAYCSTTQFLSTLIEQTLQKLKIHIPEAMREITPHLSRLKKDPLGHFDKLIMSIQKTVQYQPLVVIMDEFQYLCELREEAVTSQAIFRHLRSLSQHGQGIHFIFSGGGLLSELINQPGLAPLLNITFDEKLSSLGELAASSLIKDGLTRVSEIEEEAVDFLLKTTSGHPYYLQLLCYKLFEQAQQDKTIITQASASETTYEWLRQADESRFQHLWEGKHGIDSQMNKVILSAIAQLEADNGEVEYDHLYEAVYSLIQERNLVRSLEDLTYMGVIKHNQLKYAIEVDLFARWMRQHWPLKLALKEVE